MENLALAAANLIRKKIPDFTPKLGIILGSGLGDIAHQISQPIILSYRDLPGFVQPSVKGHEGKLFLGKLCNYPVVCMQGRAHLYEGVGRTTILNMIRTLKLIGCEILLITNSAGSLRPEVVPGNLMLINDHINFQFCNPLVGPNDEEFGPRFVAMENTYDLALCKNMLDIAKRINIQLPQGVYFGVLGPVFETPAEIRAFRILGADAVGMSTVAEVIAARHCGLRVVAVSGITNMAVGMTDVKVTHEQTLAGAETTIKDMTKLVLAFVESLNGK